MLQQGGADPDDVVIAKAKYQAQLQEYKSFCKDMDLTPQMERVYIDNLGRVALNTTQHKKLVEGLKSKYNKDADDDNLKMFEKDSKLKSAIRSGKYNLKVHEGKQGKHIVGHNNYVEGRSIVSISSEKLQSLIYKHAGTGDIIRTRKDIWNNKEVVDFREPIGEYIDRETGERIQTSVGTIHYSKDGIHVVPAKPRED